MFRGGIAAVDGLYRLTSGVAPCICDNLRWWGRELPFQSRLLETL